MIADFREKRNREFYNNKLFFKTLGVIFITVIFILVVLDFRIYLKKRELYIQIDNYQKQIENIKKSSQTLKDEIANSDNIDYLEKLGYEQFDQTRPGETEYMFVKSQNKTETTGNSQNSWIQSIGNWFESVWLWIKSKF